MTDIAIRTIAFVLLILILLLHALPPGGGSMSLDGPNGGYR